MDAVRELSNIGFFNHLIILKIRSTAVITMINKCYIDDFLFYLPPHPPTAGNICNRFSFLLRNVGFLEKYTKREGPE